MSGSVYTRLAFTLAMLVCSLAKTAGAIEPDLGLKKLFKRDKQPLIEMLASGRNLEQSGKFAAAATAYKKCIEQYPKKSQAYHRMGVVCDKQRRHGEAVTWYEKAIKIEPKNAEYHNDLGYSYYLAGKLDEALERLQKAVKLEDSNPRIRNNIGLVYGAQGKLQEALEEFRIGGSEADAQFNLAFVHSVARRDKEARACIEKALAIDPNHRQANSAITAFDRADLDPEGWKQDMQMARDGRQFVPYVEGMEKDPGVVPAASFENLPPSIAAKMTINGDNRSKGMNKADMTKFGNNVLNTSPNDARQQQQQAPTDGGR